MGKRSTVVAVVALALLLSGIVLAVVRLYRTTPGEVSTTAPAPAGWSVLKAIPSDANAVMVFDGSSKAARLMADSTGFSIVLALAAKAGLKTVEKDGFLLASRSETFINAAVRHMDEETSILGVRHLQDLVRSVSGPAVVFLSHAQAGKLVQTYGGTAYRPHTTFVKDLTAWSAWSFQEADKDHVLLKGAALPGEAPGSFFRAYQNTPVARPEFPDILPYYTRTAVSIPVTDADALLASRRSFEDGCGRLAKYNKSLKSKEGRPLTPEAWFQAPVSGLSGPPARRGI